MSDKLKCKLKIRSVSRMEPPNFNSEQWYCPNCGPTKVRADHCRESDSTFISCTQCEGMDLLQEPPAFVLAMQKRIAALEADALEKAGFIVAQNNELITLRKVAVAAEGTIQKSIVSRIAVWPELRRSLRAAGYLKGEGDG